MKKIIDDPATVVADSLAGLAVAHPDLVRVEYDPDIVVRADSPARGVSLISGGGSGHEPLHTGFVGPGMLHAAVPGPVFTSPTPDAVQAAISATTGKAGALLVVKNYTGDVLNFETAAELASADELDVRTVVVNDDVAVADSTFTAGRRGVGGTVLLEKIAGAAAERGESLDAVESLSQQVVDEVRSIGVALTAPTVPHVGEPSFELADDEVEFGIGIHGEPGRERLKSRPARELVDRMVAVVADDLALERGDEVLLFTNSMGGSPLLEVYLAHGIAERLLADRGVTVVRRLIGPYITSLEMQGISMTMLRMDDRLTELWDAPVRTPALRWGM